VPGRKSITAYHYRQHIIIINNILPSTVYDKKNSNYVDLLVNIGE